MRALKPHSGLHYCDMAGTVRGCLHVMYEAVGSHVRYPPCRNNAGQSAVLMLALDGLLIFFTIDCGCGVRHSYLRCISFMISCERLRGSGFGCDCSSSSSMCISVESVSRDHVTRIFSIFFTVLVG